MVLAAVLRVHCERATGLRNVQSVLQQEPFVHATSPWGEVATSRTGRGSDPVWKAKSANVLELPYYGTPLPPLEDVLVLKVLDWEALREARLIGAAAPLALGKLVASLAEEAGGREMELALSDVSGAPAGRLFVRLEVVLKGRLEVTVREGTVRDLRQRLHAQENYVQVSLLHERVAPAQAGGGEPEPESAAEAPAQRRCTKAARGLRPVWKKDNVLEFELSGQGEPRLLIECMGKVRLLRDQVVGTGAVKLTGGSQPAVTLHASPEQVCSLCVDLVDPHFLPGGRIWLDVRYVNAAYDANKPVVRGLAWLGAGALPQLGAEPRALRSLRTLRGEVDSVRELYAFALAVQEELSPLAPGFVKRFAATSSLPVSPGTLGLLFWLWVLLVALGVLVRFGARMLSLLVGVLYPAYMSFKAVESGNKSDDTHWLTYWVLFALLEMVEHSLFAVLRLVNPFHGVLTYLFNLCAYIVLQNPRWRAAEFIYLNTVAPFLRAHEKEFDKRLSATRKEIEKEIEQELELLPEELAR
jgi:receptor expression-enhancing protein 5/6